MLDTRMYVSSMIYSTSTIYTLHYQCALEVPVCTCLVFIQFVSLCVYTRYYIMCGHNVAI